MVKSEKLSISCPSYVAKPNTELFGIFNQHGQVSYLKNSIIIDEIFIEEAKKGRPPEERFRIAGNCIQKACEYWNNEKCNLIEKVINTLEKPISANLQHCSIRYKCRWFIQEKELACANCNEVFRNQETIYFT